MILDPNGLYDGDRINACSKMARLYYPWIIAASNSCGRLPIDYTAIISKAFFRWPQEDKPSEAELRSYIKEYAANYLIFLYRINRQEWGQWDTAKCTFGKYRNTQDMRSPEPDAKEFEEWRNTYKQNKIFKYEKVNPNDFHVNSGQIQMPFQGSAEDAPEVGNGIGIGVGDRCEVNGIGENPRQVKNFTLNELAIMTLTILGLGHSTRGRLIDATAEAIRIKSGESGLDPPAAAQEITTNAVAYKKWAESQPKTKSWENWFADGDWRKPISTWTEGKNNGQSETADQVYQRALRAARTANRTVSGEADGVGGDAIPPTATPGRTNPGRNDGRMDSPGAGDRGGKIL